MFHNPVATWFIVLFMAIILGRKTFWSVNLDILLNCSSCCTDNVVFKLLMFSFLLKKDTEQPEIHVAFFWLLMEDYQWKIFQERLHKVALEPSKQMIQGFLDWPCLVGKKVSTAVICLQGILWLGSAQIRVSILQ